MGRAQTRETQAQLNQQLGITNQILQEQRGERAKAREVMVPQYTKMLDEGYSPEQESAMAGEYGEALGNVFDVQRQAAGRRVAQTRNTAGYYGAMGEVGREEGRQRASGARQLKLIMADERQRRRLEGLQGLGGIYGTETGAMGTTQGATGQLLGTKAQLAAVPGFWGRFGPGLLQAGGQAASAYFANR